MRFIFSAVAAMLLFPGLLCAQTPQAFGYLEKVKVGPNSLAMRAKLDSGADTSSLGYQKLDRFTKDGADWVMVTVSNAEGYSFSTSRKVVRTATIRRHGGPSIRRPVIIVAICLGGIKKMTEVTLADRKRFSTPVLLGRNFLAGTATVDTARKYTTVPDCDGEDNR